MSDLRELVGHLGSAAGQLIPSDDAIIADHIRQALAIAQRMLVAEQCPNCDGTGWREAPDAPSRFSEPCECAAGNGSGDRNV